MASFGRVDAVLMTLPLFVGVASWSRLPEQLVIHWSGGSPDTAVAKPLALFGIYALGVGTALFTRNAPSWMRNTPGGERLSVLFVGVVFAWVLTVVVAWNLGFLFDVWLATLPILVGAGLLVLYGAYRGRIPI